MSQSSHFRLQKLVFLCFLPTHGDESSMNNFVSTLQLIRLAFSNSRILGLLVI